LGSIIGIQEHAIELTPELTRDYQIALRTLHRDLFDDFSVESLTTSRAALLGILEDYRAKAQVCQSGREEDLRSMIGTLALAAETMSSHNDTHSAKLREFTDQLRTTARETDLSQMKRDLRKQVEALGSATRSIWNENNDSICTMQSKLNQFQERLEQAEKRATTDALTGLLNRGEGERLLLRHMDAEKTISVMLIDLNRFKQINDHWGHSCGDQVLRVFSRNLEQLVRPSDIVCRWGGDEFLVILESGSAIAQERARELRELLRFRHRLVMVGKYLRNRSQCFGGRRSGVPWRVDR